jgi:hypothetical protein
MKIEICLRYIHQRYHNITKYYDTEQEVEAIINIHLRLPKIITWKKIIKLSIIIGICKEFFRAQNQSIFIVNLLTMVQQNEKDLRYGFMKRYYGKLKDLPEKNEPKEKITSLLTSKL